MVDEKIIKEIMSGKKNLRGAGLKGAELNHANLSGADLNHANLSGADLGGAYVNDEDLRDNPIWGR